MSDLPSLTLLATRYVEKAAHGFLKIAGTDNERWVTMHASVTHKKTAADAANFLQPCLLH